MNTVKTKLRIAYWLVTAALFAAAVVMVFVWTPTEATIPFSGAFNTR